MQYGHPCNSPKVMLKRQDAQLVSLMNISGEEFVFPKQQPEKKRKEKQTKLIDLEGQMQVYKALPHDSIMKCGSNQITKLNSQCTVQHCYCHNL